MWLGLTLFCIACALARRLQGVSEETWPVKRQLRMLLLWVPLAGVFALVGISHGLEGYYGLMIGAIPGLWSWMPGKYNSFLIYNIFEGRIPYVVAEAGQGFLGGLVSSVILLSII